MPLVASAEPGWGTRLKDLPPGDHAAILTGTPATGVVGRLAGWELRDTLSVLLPGPASGYVFLFRRPVEAGTVAAQTLATGTGGLNIAGCRVGLTGGTRRSGQAQHFLKDDGTEDRSHHWARTGHTVVEITEGRWPPNVLLVHALTCQRVDTEWECGDGCPVPILDGLSGERPVSGAAASGKSAQRNPTELGAGSSQVALPNDMGGASRFYPQFADDLELLAWLAVLVGIHMPE